MRWVMIAMTVALLVGCASAGEVCSKKGYSPGTDAYAKCMKTQSIPD